MNQVQSAEPAIDLMLKSYDGGLTVKQIANLFGFSVGKTFNLLRAAGCCFRKPKDYPQHFSDSERKRRADAQRGRHLSAETRKKISDARTIGYNGMNGFGHTKPHGKGYVLAYAPQHPKAHRDGYVMLHTVIMERSIGRYLADNEEVHHINHIRDDNRIENLRLMDRDEHRALHSQERRAALSTQ